jgi:hypothetical protein
LFKVLGILSKLPLKIQNWYPTTYLGSCFDVFQLGLNLSKVKLLRFHSDLFSLVLIVHIITLVSQTRNSWDHLYYPPPSPYF